MERACPRFSPRFLEMELYTTRSKGVNAIGFGEPLKSLKPMALSKTTK